MMRSSNDDVKFRILSSSLLLLSIIVSCVLVVEANIGHFDDHWKQRQADAKKKASAAYNPNPHNVTNHLNLQVHKAVNESEAEYGPRPEFDEDIIEEPEGNNSTRRGLFGTQYHGECFAANPIDRCWRCDPNWAQNRQKLADCVLGFGHKVRGGQGGKIYVVNDTSDSDLVNPKPGTLRHAVIQKEPLWIIFQHGMVIRLTEELMIASNKTIDGRGGHVHIAGGAGLTLQFVDNVIVHNIHVHDIKVGSGGMIRDSLEHFGLRTRSDGDGISLFGATNVWIDHVSMSNCADGLIDAIEMCTAITISNCHFTDHNDVMLFGAHDDRPEDKIQQITLAFNHFGKRLIQRMPRCRWGFFHVVNNDYTHWEMYAIGGSQAPTIICQGNRFIAPPNPNAKEVTKRDFAPENEWKQWLWVSENDEMINGAYFRGSGDKSKMAPFSKIELITAKPGTYVRRLTRFSGALNCKEGLPC